MNLRNKWTRSKTPFPILKDVIRAIGCGRLLETILYVNTIVNIISALVERT